MKTMNSRVTRLVSATPPTLFYSSSSIWLSLSSSWKTSPLSTTTTTTRLTSSSPSQSSRKQICRAAEYRFPNPIPGFADAETEKFRSFLLDKLSKKDVYEDSVEVVVDICTEILGTFLHSEYGGPGTLLVVPFIDMADTLNEQGLPGGPQAARAAIKWAQNHVDKDWKEWTGDV